MEAVSEDAVQYPSGKNQKGQHLNTPPLWEISRAQHCQAGRYSWAMEKMTVKQLLAEYAKGKKTLAEPTLKESALAEPNRSGIRLSGQAPSRTNYTKTSFLSGNCAW